MKRIIILLFSLLILSICVYFRFHSPLDVDFIKPRILNTLLSLLIVILTFRIVIYIVVIWYRIDRKNGSGKLRDNLIVGLSNLFNIIYVIALILAFLTIFGFNPKEVFTSLSIIAAAIAIIAKDFITEIIIGLYNGFSNKIELDDYVKIGEYKGKILDLGLQRVTLQSDDDDIIYIPNLKFYNYEIINYTKKDIRTMSIEFSLDPKSNPHLGSIEKMLNETLREFSHSVEEGTQKLNVVSIGYENIDFKYQYMLKSVSREIQREIKKKLMRRLIETIGK